LFVVITILSYCLPSCSNDLSILSLAWFDTYLVQSLQSKVHIWRVEVPFVKTWGICWSTGCECSTLLWGSFSSSTIDIDQELHSTTTSLILDFGCISLLFSV
jgi:hypothetical protein